MKKPFTHIAIFIFTLMALLHVIRLFFGLKLAVNGVVVPLWASVLGVLIAGVLAVMLWRESR